MSATSYHHEHDGHCHHGHSHELSADADFSRLGIALGLLIGFTAIEFVISLRANSMALLADAGHMLTDVGAIGLSMVAIRLSQRPATGDTTYGLKRVKILSALINGVTLVAMACFIAFESIRRLMNPPEVHGSMVLYVALVGIGVNYLAVRTLAKANREDLNVEGSFQHMLTDLYAFIGTAIAGLIILLTGFNRIDPIMSLLVAYLMFRSGGPLILASCRIFLQIAPGNLASQVRAAMESHPGINQVSDLHIWTLTSGEHHLSAHVTVNDREEGTTVCHALCVLVAEKFGVHHATVQPRYQHEPEVNHRH